MRLRLRPLRASDEREVTAAAGELEADGFAFLLGRDEADDWPEYVELMSRRSRGESLTGRLVPATFLLAECDGAIVGRSSIRHELDEFLLNEGGHIGYCVRPAYRRRGYAGEILRQSLVIARSEGIERVLVTCDGHNEASARVIEGAGGELEDVRIGSDGIEKRRYWFS